jgi:hypothetical protein
MGLGEKNLTPVPLDHTSGMPTRMNGAHAVARGLYARSSMAG